MLRRVASSLFWMSRYLERADNVARFIDVNRYLMLDLSLSRAETLWSPLVDTSGDTDDFYARYAQADEKSVVRFLTFDEKNQNSILSCIMKARENARTVREIIPAALWESINVFYHFIREQSRKRSVANLESFYASVHTLTHQFTGLMYNSMSQDEGWYFAHAGQMMERADKTMRLIDVKFFRLQSRQQVDPTDIVQWGAVLKSADALEMYRQTYHRIAFTDVIEFLMFSKQFPRSARFCIEKAHDALLVISPQGFDNRASQSVRAVRDSLNKLTAQDLINQGLHEQIDTFQSDLNRLGQHIYESYFS